MPDLKKIIDLIKPLKEWISQTFFEGKELPNLLDLGIDYLFGLILLSMLIWLLMFIFSKIKRLWIEDFWPLFYKPEQKRRRLKRQRFAGYLEDEIKKLNRREEWKDYRFTELEAEIEAEGRRKKSSFISFIQTPKRGLRREKSLSKALRFSTERLILVEGEPGSGKSVALRHVTQKLAKKANTSNNLKSVIPLYINLKKLERDSQEIDRNLIESFVIQELNRINDRDIEEFLDKEFYQGLKEGTWLFLFDSFDELPEVLSSVEADEVTRNYAEAIDDFLHSLNNQCRGIIASRQFRGPKHLGWPRFRILPLENRRLELIRKAELEPPIEKELIKQWRNASHEIQEMTKNPMFLGILCENMRDGGAFPENGHTVFESYLDKRLTRDQERLKKRFNLEPNEVRAIAEQVAFCMTLDKNLGLSPTREAIGEGMTDPDVGFRVPGHFDKLLNALEYLKLARSEEETIAGESHKFTFSHRRFQEYFATCIVLRDLERISPKQLLKDGRWRETTVVIFQTQPSETFMPILTEANKMLTEMVGNVSGLIDDPRGYVNDESQEKKTSSPQPFSWPDGVIHLLGILQDGFRSRLEDLGDDIKYQAECLLLSATVTGTLQDRKWALEVAGITSQPILLWLLRAAFASESQWLKEVAYQQTARLKKIPDDIAAAIRRTLLYLFSTGRLYKEYFTTEAHLSRLDNPKQYLNSLRLLRWIKPIDLGFNLILLIWIFLGFNLFYLNIELYNFVYDYFLNFDHRYTYFGYSFLRSKSIILAISQTILVILSYTLIQNFSLIVSLLSFSREKNKKIIKLQKSEFSKLFTWEIMLIIYIRLLIFPFLALWAIFAILAANTGKFTYQLWWPFLLLFPFLYLISNYKNLIKIFRKNIGNPKTYVLISSSIVCLIVYIKIVQWLLENSDTILGKSIIAIGMILGVFSVGYFSIEVFKFSKNWLKDWNKLRKWVKQNKYPNTIKIQELLNLISLYHTQGFIKELIIISRERDLVVANKDTENLLTELARVIETSLFLRTQEVNRAKRINKIIRRKRQKIVRNIVKNPSNIIKLITSTFESSKHSLIERMIETYSGSDFFTDWLKQYTRKDKKRLVDLGSEFLDELYMLIEQIQARQKTSEKSNN
ncbi:MAG: NACHT domain-containing protein [Crocosphaera sp.]|nr:NACHT domain-containing protein [Crocosphaera sp.]